MTFINKTNLKKIFFFKFFLYVYISLYHFFYNLILLFFNKIVSNIPFHFVRLFFYRFVLKLGKSSSILMNVKIRSINKITIGNFSTVNSGVTLDGRGGSLDIGNCVDIAPNVNIITVTHDPNNNNHGTVNKNVKINDYVWIASNVIVLPGVEIGKGTVVAAGSVVTKDLGEMLIVAGNPARILRKRKNNLNYQHCYRPWFQ